MFVSLVKIKKYLIYFFLFLFFNCIFISSLNANPQFRARLDIHGFDLGFNANQTFNKNINQEAELKLTYNF